MPGLVALHGALPCSWWSVAADRLSARGDTEAIRCMEDYRRQAPSKGMAQIGSNRPGWDSHAADGGTAAAPADGSADRSVLAHQSGERVDGAYLKQGRPGQGETEPTSILF